VISELRPDRSGKLFAGAEVRRVEFERLRKFRLRLHCPRPPAPARSASDQVCGFDSTPFYIEVLGHQPAMTMMWQMFTAQQTPLL